MSNRIDIAGMRFSRLVALRPVQSTNRNAKWECVCDCGNVTVVNSLKLRSGNTKSCGCWQSEIAAKRFKKMMTVHGLSRTKAYKAWNSMKLRCLNPGHRAYENYGGRGIGVCERWMQFADFLEDMGQPPKGMTLDRKNNDQSYSPENCRWATRTEQANNRRVTIFVTANGKSKTLSEWSRELNVSYATLFHRNKRRGSFERKNKNGAIITMVQGEQNV